MKVRVEYGSHPAICLTFSASAEPLSTVLEERLYQLVGLIEPEGDQDDGDSEEYDADLDQALEMAPIRNPSASVIRIPPMNVIEASGGRMTVIGTNPA